jgi:hypothetical protein
VSRATLRPQYSSGILKSICLNYLSMPPSPSEHAAARIPRIGALRNALGFNDPKSERSSAFIDDIRLFRKKYYTSSGLCGSSLHNWTSKNHQSELEKMAYTYLKEYGSEFWPNHGPSDSLR